MPGRVVLLLIGARGVFRLTVQAGPLALLPVWGAGTFAQYANAVGVCTWLIYVSAGAEKAALKLLPRSRRLTGDVVRWVLAVAAVPVLPVLVALAVAGPGRPRLYLAAGLWSLANGLLILLAALHRLAGRPVRDAVIFGTMAAATVTMIGLTWLLDLSPVQLLLALAAVALGLTGLFVVALPRPWLRERSGRRSRRIVLRSLWLLGLADMLGSLCGTVAYAALGLSGQTADSDGLYIAMLFCVGFGALLTLLLRLAQPRTSVRLRGTGAIGGRRTAVRLLRAGALGGVVSAAALGLGVAAGLSPVALLALVAVCEIPVYAAVTYGANLVENTDGQALSLTSGSSAAGLAVCVLAAAVLVPPLGAAGALAAVLLSYAAKSAALWRFLVTHYDAGRR